MAPPFFRRRERSEEAGKPWIRWWWLALLVFGAAMIALMARAG